MKTIITVLVCSGVSFLLGAGLGVVGPTSILRLEVDEKKYLVEKEGRSVHLTYEGETIMWIGVGPMGYMVFNETPNGIVLYSRFDMSEEFDLVEINRTVAIEGERYAVFYGQEGEVDRKVKEEDLRPDTLEGL